MSLWLLNTQKSITLYIHLVFSVGLMKFFYWNALQILVFLYVSITEYMFIGGHDDKKYSHGIQ